MNDKLRISFHKKGSTTKELETWMQVNGLSPEEGFEIYAKPVKERNKAIKKIIEKRGVVLEIEREVAREIEQEHLYPKEEIKGPEKDKWKKRVDTMSDVNTKIAEMCERMYRKISSRMAEQCAVVPLEDMKSFYPEYFERIENLENQIKPNMELSEAEKTCDRIMEYYDKVFMKSRHRVNEIKKQEDSIGELLQGIIGSPKQQKQSYQLPIEKQKQEQEKIQQEKDFKITKDTKRVTQTFF